MAEDGDEELAALATAAEDAERGRATWAKRLGASRRRAARSARAVDGRRSCAQLALDGARFTVRFARARRRPLGPTGADEVEFFLAANPGEEPRPLARVASGGELSRIMLALKTARRRATTTARRSIFDEVDAGIGGARGGGGRPQAAASSAGGARCSR